MIYGLKIFKSGTLLVGINPFYRYYVITIVGDGVWHDSSESLGSGV